MVTARHPSHIAAPLGANSDRLSRVALAFIALLAIVLAPVLLVEVPPLCDYPNNLARVYVLLNHDKSELLRTYYDPMLTVQPNMAMDLVVMALGRLMPIEWAGKAFIALTFVVLAAGTILLHRAIFGGWSLWPCVVFLFAYNKLFLWGFLGFLFTLGVTLLALAVWISIRDQSYAVRFVVNSAMAFAVFFGHLFCLGVLGVVVGGYEIFRQIQRQRAGGRFSVAELVAACIPLVLPLVLFVATSPAAGAANVTRWGPLVQRLLAPAYVVRNYSMGLDMATAAAFALLIGWGLWRRKLRLSGTVVIGMVVLAAIQLVLPDKLFSSYFADRRIPLVIALLLVAGTSWAADARRAKVFALSVLAVFFAVRMVVVGQVWAEADRQYAAVLEALDRLPRGVRLAQATFTLEPLPPIPMHHLSTMAVIRRDAFVPILFAYPLNAAQAIAFHGDFAQLARLTPQAFVIASNLPSATKLVERRGMFAPEHQDCYEYLLMSQAPDYTFAAPAGYRPVAKGPGFELLATRAAGQSFERCTLVKRDDVHLLPSRNGYEDD